MTILIPLVSTLLSLCLHTAASPLQTDEKEHRYVFECEDCVNYFCDRIIFRADAGNSLESLVEEFRDSTVYPILLNPFAVRLYFLSNNLYAFNFCPD